MGKERIFICEEESSSRQQLLEILGERHWVIETFSSSGALLRVLETRTEDLPHLIILDADGEAPSGIEVLRRIKVLHPEQAVIMTSVMGTVRSAVTAMRSGALDFLIQPFSAQDLLTKVDMVLEYKSPPLSRGLSRTSPSSSRSRDQVVVKSKAFQGVFDLAQKVAPSDANVLIQGESGTGKELIASTIHHNSNRCDQRFLTINCAALTDTLLESQLFGHIKGAFTGAIANRRGLLEEAHNGTLFLDEIGDISPALQANLLRVLQEGEFMPVGSARVRHADVRFVAATNKNLEEEVARGTFREDLFYRLNVVALSVPPLRERKEDIVPLVDFFLGRFAKGKGQKFSAPALARMHQYDWPGNVRELENVVEMALIFADGGEVLPEHLPAKLAEVTQVDFVLPKDHLRLADVERLYIDQVYRKTRFHKSKTAEILGISRKTLDRKLVRFDIGKGRPE